MIPGFRRPTWLATTVGAAAATICAPANAAPTPANGLTNELREAQTCQMCHTFNNAKAQAADPLYAPYIGWQGSLMANAARDPVFWAGVAIADQDHPGETVDCIRCHSPRAFLEGRGDATEITDLQPRDLDGVTCEACHRMMDDSPNPLGNARYAIDDVLVDGLVPRRGPWTYDGPDTPPHSWINDPFTGSSEMCGTCHDVSTERPRVDADGNEIAPQFNEQRTYSEWANSDFAVEGDTFASCQDCHMPALEDVPGCQQFVDFFSHPTGGRRHDLVGANRFVIELLRQEYGSMGTGELADFFFDTALARTDELLATAATVDLAAPRSVHLGEGLSGVEVTVTNNSGHKLPTGYSEGRVMWLEVEATYGDDVIWTSGAYDGTAPADDGQLRTYEGVAEELSTGTTLHLLLNDHWRRDTRIPPAGLTQDLATDPVGDRYTPLPDGTWPNYDVAPYSFAGMPEVEDATPDDETDDELQITARLWYLINTPEYIEVLANDNVTNEAGNDVAMLFDTAGGAPPMLLGEATLAVPIDGFGEPPPTTGTGPDTGAVDTTAGDDDDDDDDDDDLDTGPVTTAGTTNNAEGTGTEGPGQDEDGGGGCSCSTEGRGNAAWLLLLPAVAMRRRRRRRV